MRSILLALGTIALFVATQNWLVVRPADAPAAEPQAAAEAGAPVAGLPSAVRADGVEMACRAAGLIGSEGSSPGTATLLLLFAGLSGLTLAGERRQPTSVAPPRRG